MSASDASVRLQVILNDKDFRKLSDSLTESKRELKDYQKELRELEKQTSNLAKPTDAQIAKINELNQKIQGLKQVNSEYNRQLRQIAKGTQLVNEAHKGLRSEAAALGKELQSLAEKKMGINFESLTSLVSGKIGAIGGAVTVVSALGKAMVSSAREVSAFSNQFIAFAGNARNAAEMYNKFNEVYRNTNYDEQRVYDMAKGLLAVGVSANESASLIMKCSDASAKLGKGVEFTEELVDAFKRLATGGELTEKQYKALAEAGIDLTDVQDQMRKGGMEAYEALKNKLSEYEGGMNAAKQTAAEMEGDIKGNLVEIGRQTAILVDEYFGFSDKLKVFYQWIIKTSEAVIGSIKRAIQAVRERENYNEAYEKGKQEWEDNYGADFKGNAVQRILARANYARVAADVIAETEKQKQEAITETTAAAQKQIQTIAKTGGGGHTSTPKDKTSKNNATGYQTLLKSQQAVLNNEKSLNDLKQKGRDITQQIGLIGVSDSERIKQEGLNKLDNLEAQKEQEEAMHAKRVENYDALKAYLTEHPFDGSDKILENLTLQKEQEDKMHASRIENLDKEIELNSKLTAYDQNELAQRLTTVQQQWQNYAKSVATSMGSAVASVISGEKSMGQALKQMAQQMITNALTMLAQWVALVAILAAFGDETPARHASIMMFGNDGSYMKNKDGKGGIVKATSLKSSGIKAASGGFIAGPGTGTSDSIPAMLSNGEYVLNAAAVDRIGVENLDRINYGANSTRHFASGGMAGGNNVTLSVSTLDSSSFTTFLERGGLDTIKQVLFEDDRRFGSAVGVW